MNSYRNGYPNGMRAPWDGLTVEQIDLLHPHIINLNRGRLSSGGVLSSSVADLDAIFKHYLPKELGKARSQGRELPLVFYAHGGLVSEENALRHALEQIPWWKQNGVYPIFFIWETGLWETVLQMAGIIRELQSRGDLRAFISDPVVEMVVRNGGGRLIWSGMKESARLAFGDGGGGAEAVTRLGRFVQENKEGISLHALGHSAGVIFHSHFVPAALTALEEPAIGFRTLQMLAPAITVADFHSRMAAPIGKKNGIHKTTIYTLRKELEMQDDSARVYGKSLLYLIHNALETEPATPVLGLAESLYSDVKLQQLFGLWGNESAVGDVVWSPTPSDTPDDKASQAKKHGEFDNDAATMNSVLRRIQRKEDKEPIVPYPVNGDERSPLTGDRFAQFNWPPDLFDWLFPKQSPAANGSSLPGGNYSSNLAHWGSVGSSSGRLRALCVGINKYQSSPLFGCVADARLWEKTLTGLGFTVQVLLDEQATADGILGALGRMLQESRPGDVLVFQYAGHGIQLPDVNGDEVGEDTATQDEAICPFDYSDGHFVIDDDIAQVFAPLRSSHRGVHVTCFIDCCHSGTISRFAIGAAHAQRALDAKERVRFMHLDSKTREQVIASYRLLRSKRGGGRSLIPRGPDEMQEIVFSACLSNEKAYESNQQGDFTRHATAVLGQSGLGITNEEFERRVRQAFGPNGRQHPNLDCAPANRQIPLLQAVAVGG